MIAHGEQKTRSALGIAAFSMAGCVATGRVFGSAAFESEAWQMSPHAIAIGIAFTAYTAARMRSVENTRVNALGGMISALILMVVAVAVTSNAVERLLNPAPMVFDESVLVAALALLVAFVSAFILKGGDPRDYNLRGARLHVFSQALLAGSMLIALSLGNAFGWWWIAPLNGMIAAAVIFLWSWQLLRDTRIVFGPTSDRHW